MSRITSMLVGSRNYVAAPSRWLGAVAGGVIAGLAAWEEAFKKLMSGPDTGAWFARMMAVTESGRREFFNIVH